MRAWGRVILLTALLAEGLVPLHGASTSPFLGRPLAEALETLRDGGLRLIYSSAIVTPGMKVAVEPVSREPRRILDEILVPAGLEARPGPHGSLLIVRSTRQQAPERLPGHVEQVIVTPSEPSPPSPGQAGAHVMERDDMALLPARGGDTSRMIHHLPGVAAADSSAGFHARGGASRDVSMVLDGLELYDPFHLPELQSPYSLVDSAYVDRMEFQSGSFTAEYGDRHGGFVNLFTAPPAGPDVTRAEVGSLNSRLSWSGAARDSALMVSARAWYPGSLNGTLQMGEDGLDPKFGDVYVKSTYTAVPDTVISGHALVSYDRLRYLEPRDGETANSDHRSAHVWVRAVKSWSNRLTTDTTLSVGRLDYSREGAAATRDAPIFVDDNRTVDFFGIDHDITWRYTGRQLLRGGVLVRPIRGRYSYRRISGAEDLGLQPDHAGTSFGFYVAHRAALTDRVAMEAGLRWDGQTFTGNQQISPRLNVLWRTGDRSEVMIGAGRFAQSQRIHELNIEDGETSFHPAELADQVTLTFHHRFDAGIRLRVDGYYRNLSMVQPRYENLFRPLEIFPETAPDRVRIAPTASRLRGAEIQLQGAASPLHWSAGYSWSTAVDELDGETVPRSWDQTHAVKVILGYRPDAHWLVALSGTAHTGWPTTPVTATSTLLPDGTVEVTPVPGERNSERLPGYVRFDLHASRSFRMNDALVLLNLDILNLTDRDNACCVDELRYATDPGGNIQVDRRLDSWPGLTPVLSLAFQF